jgi:hypothetical protein
MCKRPSFLALCPLFFALLLSGSPARAQQNANRSDALILVQPDGPGLQVSVTYPSAVPHGVARDRFTKLAQGMGWTPKSVQVKDEEIVSHPDYGPQKVLGRQTGLSAFVPRGAYTRNGGFVLQPYIEAFRDLKRFEVFFFVPPVQGFQGLREFDSPAVYVKLIREGGPYRYYVEVRTPGARIPSIPLTQAVVAPPAPPALNHPPAAPGPADFAPVVITAAAAALLVFFALMLRARLRSSRPEQAQESPASRITIVRRDR